MKKRRIRIVIWIAALVVVLTLCGTVLAYMFKQTGYEENWFTPAEVSCRVQEVTDSPLTQKTSIQVQNTGNVDAYLRIRIVSYWVDSDGEIVAKPSSIPEISLASGWAEGSNSTYYYTSPVAPEGFTGELLSSPLSLEKDENGYLQVIEVFAEAIQSKPTTAVTDSWKVTIGADGSIAAVS